MTVKVTISADTLTDMEVLVKITETGRANKSYTVQAGKDDVFYISGNRKILVMETLKTPAQPPCDLK